GGEGFKGGDVGWGRAGGGGFPGGASAGPGLAVGPGGAAELAAAAEILLTEPADAAAQECIGKAARDDAAADETLDRRAGVALELLHLVEKGDELAQRPGDVGEEELDLLGKLRPVGLADGLGELLDGLADPVADLFPVALFEKMGEAVDDGGDRASGAGEELGARLLPDLKKTAPGVLELRGALDVDGPRRASLRLLHGLPPGARALNEQIDHAGREPELLGNEAGARAIGVGELAESIAELLELPAHELGGVDGNPGGLADLVDDRQHLPSALIAAARAVL